MHRQASGRSSMGVIVAWVLIAASAHGYPPAQAATQGRSTSQAAQGLKENERKLLLAKVRANPIISRRMKEHKTRVIRLHRGMGDPATTLEKYQQSSFTVLLFDYTANKAVRYVLESASGNLISEQTLPGRPQPSEEEIQAAVSIVQADPDLAKLLKAGNRAVGGFVVDGPAKSAPDHRFLQLRIVSADMRRTERVVVVDLTSDLIASK